MVRVKTRRYNKRGVLGWEADITIKFPDGMPPHRVRKLTGMNTQRQAYDWGLSTGIELSKKGRPGSVPTPPPPPICITFKEFILVYLDRWVTEKGLTQSTYRLREQQIRLYFTKLLPLPLDRITEERVLEVKSSMRLKQNGKPRSGSSSNLIMSVLGHMLKKAYDWKLCPTPPPRMPERVRQVEQEVEIYSAEELSRLVKAAKELSTQAYLIVLLGTEAGLRVAEMIGLRWTDVDLLQKCMVVRQQEATPGEITPLKSKKTRKIPLTPLLRAALKGAQHWGERVLMMASANISRMQIGYWLIRSEKRAQLIGCKSPHKLRHTFASRLLAKGAKVTAVQALLGHKSLKTTIRYLHLFGPETEEAILLLSGDKPETAEESVET